MLLEPALALLDPRPGEVAADATAGLGGHASAIAPRLAPGGAIVLNDLDPANLARAEARVRAAAPGVEVAALRGNFAELPAEMERRGLRADTVLADLGFASTHVDDPARGFSFRADGPLDMRYDTSAGLTAADLVNRMAPAELARVLREFGEEPRAGAFASKIVEARRAGPILTTRQLAEVIHSAAGSARGPGGLDSATRAFQALRIAVNDEIGVLGAFLTGIESGARRVQQVGSWLAPGARVAVITFHSLEDRPVKRAFESLVRAGLAEHLARRPAVAQECELGKNPRARSAKLRAVRLIPRADAAADTAARRGSPRRKDALP